MRERKIKKCNPPITREEFRNTIDQLDNIGDDPSFFYEDYIAQLHAELDAIKNDLACTVSELDTLWLYKIPALEARIAALTTPQEWQLGDEGWFWEMDAKAPKPHYIQEDAFWFSGIHFSMHDCKKKGYRFYRAILPEVE